MVGGNFKRDNDGSNVESDVRSNGSNVKPIESKKYLIFGMGALGSVFGGFLQKSGYNVSYIGLGDHYNEVLCHGLQITGIWGQHFIPTIRGYNDYKDIPEKFDIILLCVKSIHTSIAVEQACTLLAKNGIIVSIQNGLNNVEKIAKFTEKNRVIGGRIIFGVENPQPGTVNVSVYADKVLLGPAFCDLNDMPNDYYDNLLSIVKSLDYSGIPTECVDKSEIIAKIWEKVLYNSALNPLGALFEVTYGALGDNPITYDYMRNIIEEIFQILEKKSINLRLSKSEDYFKYFLEKLLPPTRDHHSSMLQDINEGRMTEIDSLNGAISAYGVELGVQTPYNTILTQMIKGKEKFKKK